MVTIIKYVHVWEESEPIEQVKMVPEDRKKSDVLIILTKR